MDRFAPSIEESAPQATKAASAQRVVCARPVACIFAEPTLTAEVISQSIYGATIEVLEQLGCWWRIRSSDGYEGFVQASDFSPSNTSPGQRRLRVRQLSANVYLVANVKASAPLLNVPFEALLDFAGEEGTGEDDAAHAVTGSDQAKWLTVRLVDGSIGYVQSGDVALEPEPCSLAGMLALSHRFLGITYTWGGTSTRGFDCSGYVQMLFRQAGVVLPRDAQAQADWTGFAAVDMDSLQPADVVFFGVNPRAITHVGLYLGDGLFIHETTEAEPCIQISRLDEMPWKQRLTARRRLRR